MGSSERADENVQYVYEIQLKTDRFPDWVCLDETLLCKSGITKYFLSAGKGVSARAEIFATTYSKRRNPENTASPP